MKTIPQVRNELTIIANVLKDAGNISISNKIKRLVSEMKRRPAIRRAVSDSATFTPTLAKNIRTYANKYRSFSYRDIAETFNVSVGRVSEAIVGKRAA